MVSQKGLNGVGSRGCFGRVDVYMLSLHPMSLSRQALTVLTSRGLSIAPAGISPCSR